MESNYYQRPAPKFLLVVCAMIAVVMCLGYAKYQSNDEVKPLCSSYQENKGTGSFNVREMLWSINSLQLEVDGQ